MQSRLKVIHVGVGGRGLWPVQLFADEPERWESVALVDVSQTALAEAAQIARLQPDRCTQTLDAALAGPGRDADAVVVITPSARHGRFVRRALEAGKHVLVEKPFVHDVEEAEALVALAESRGLRLVVAQQYRLRPAQQTLRRLLAERAYGRVGYATFVHHRHRPDPRAFTMPHSMLVEMSVHHFDDFRCIFGAEPTAITAHSFNPPWSRYPGEAAVQALLEWDVGAAFVLAYTGTFTSASDLLECRIECEHAALVWDDRGVWSIAAGQKSRSPVALPDAPRRAEHQVADAWLAYIHGAPEPPISGHHNLGTLHMIDAAIRSSESRQRVTL